ncbi:MAG: transcription termination/antitermination NusG family protein [Opitutales bacterium]|nr:transcription termination/antitermination NusG family protein [Opitutales bacterium]
MTESAPVYWYCLKAKTKREHIAAQILRSRTDLEVFCPRVSITKKTVRGPKAFTEALFPGYLFCRFNFEESSRLVSYAQDIKGIVKFGQQVPLIPDLVVENLKVALPQETAEIKPPTIEEGELVEIIQGCFQGESGKVTQVDKCTNRVNLLIEFLGNHVQIEVPSHSLINSKPSNPGESLGLQATANP